MGITATMNRSTTEPTTIPIARGRKSIRVITRMGNNNNNHHHHQQGNVNFINNKLNNTDNRSNEQQWKVLHNEQMNNQHHQKVGNNVEWSNRIEWEHQQQQRWTTTTTTNVGIRGESVQQHRPPNEVRQWPKNAGITNNITIIIVVGNGNTNIEQVTINNNKWTRGIPTTNGIIPSP